MLIPIAVTLPDYNKGDKDKVKVCLEKAYQQWLMFVYITNTDHAKYGTLLSTLSSQYSLGQDQYPKTLVNATNVLSNHHFDSAYTERDKKRKVNREKQRTENRE